MADPSAAERAYRRVRSDIINGTLPTGPIDVRTLGDKLKMSVTPVREALARLSAERLVTLAPHQGYAVTHLSAQRLENLYELTAALVQLALARCVISLRGRKPRPDPARDARSYQAGMASIVQEIARAQGNIELAEHLGALNDRLYSARRCEALLFKDAMDELHGLISLWDRQLLPRLQTRFSRHFAVRLSHVDGIARMLAEAADEI